GRTARRKTTYCTCPIPGGKPVPLVGINADLPTRREAGDICFSSSKPQSFASSLAAPWVAVVRPLTGAKRLLSASPWALVFVACLHAAVFAGGLVLLRLWADSIRVEYSARNRPPVMVQRSLVETWQQWHTNLIGPAEFYFLAGFLILAIAAALLSGLIVARIHTGSSLRR